MRAARCAAVSRLGWTSVAFIEPEWSVSMIDGALNGDGPVLCGLAKETASVASAASASAAGKWRRQADRARGESQRVGAAVKRTA